MKQFSISVTLAAVLLGGWLAAPLSAHALTPSAFEGKYTGTYAYTRDTCMDATLGTGGLTVRLLDVKADGAIADATVKFEDSDRVPATGEIFKKDGRRWMYLNYSDASGDYVIMARLTPKKKIRGFYDHTTYSDNCNWGGSVNLKKAS